MDAGGFRHRSAVGQGKIRQRLPGQGEEVEIHSRSQSSLQVTVAKSSGDGTFFILLLSLSKICGSNH